jgi:hypothetical protein
MGNEEQDRAMEQMLQRGASELRYVRGADGAFFQEVPRPGGGFDYLPAEAGVDFAPAEDGYYVSVRDKAVAAEQASWSSHLDRFYDEKDGRLVKKNLKQLNALERQLQQMAIDRVSPIGIPGVRTIKDEQLEGFIKMYRQAVAEGRYKQCEFQPLQAYMHKLQTSSGKVVRPLYEGEVGMYGSDILVLEAPYGSGNRSQVPR